MSDEKSFIDLKYWYLNVVPNCFFHLSAKITDLVKSEH